MARIRTIKPEFWDDEAVGLLSREARLLFIATWNLADDEGLLRWAASYVKASVFMYDEDVSIADSQRIMGELEAGGLVFPYRGGKAQQQLAYVVNFRKHQKINRPQPGKLPPPSIQNPDVRRMYARRDNWVCALCSQTISEQRTASELDWDNTDWALSLDHKDPRSTGGSDYPSNIQIAHRRCNSARGARPLPDEPLTESFTEPFSEPDADAVSELLPLDVVPDSVAEGKGREGKGEEGKGAPTALALRGEQRGIAPASETLGQHGNRLAKAYTDRVKLSNFPAIAGIARKAIHAGKTDAEITDAFIRLAEEGRPVTADTLRIEIEGLRVRGTVASAQAETEAMFDRAAQRAASREVAQEIA